MNVWGRVIATAIVMIGIIVIARPARAESLPHLIPRLIEKSGVLKKHDPTAPSKETAEAPLPAALPDAWLGATLHTTLVARDWREAYSLTDGHPLVFDRMRVVRSSRMAVTRFSAVGGRFVPFAEISAGQWRIDPDLMPKFQRDTELASQLAVGFELQIAPRCAIAWDMEHTAIYRGTRDTPNVPVGHIVASFAAMRAEF
jgi:hypothetical protein